MTTSILFASFFVTCARIEEANNKLDILNLELNSVLNTREEFQGVEREYNTLYCTTNDLKRERNAFLRSLKLIIIN